MRCGTGIEQSPRKQSARVVEAGVIQDASSGGWGDDESENSTPDVRSWFTKTSGRWGLHAPLLSTQLLPSGAEASMLHRDCEPFVKRALVGNCREADRGSDVDRIPNNSLPKDPGKKGVAPKERGPKCQCCKQNHK